MVGGLAFAVAVGMADPTELLFREAADLGNCPGGIPHGAVGAGHSISTGGEVDFRS